MSEVSETRDNIIRVRRKTGYVTRMKEMRVAQTVLVDIKMILREKS
jgi:hypothetical protein